MSPLSKQKRFRACSPNVLLARFRQQLLMSLVADICDDLSVLEMCLLNEYFEISNDEYVGNYHGQDEIADLNELDTSLVRHQPCLALMRHLEQLLLPNYPIDANKPYPPVHQRKC